MHRELSPPMPRARAGQSQTNTPRGLLKRVAFCTFTFQDCPCSNLKPFWSIGTSIVSGSPEKNGAISIKWIFLLQNQGPSDSMASRVNTLSKNWLERLRKEAVFLYVLWYHNNSYIVVARWQGLCLEQVSAFGKLTVSWRRREGCPTTG